MKKVILLGSFSTENLDEIRRIKALYEKDGFVVYPNEEHLKRINETVRNTLSGEFEKERFELMRKFYAWMRKADMVVVCNGKCEVEIGTAIDIGIALGLGKEVTFWNPPLDPNCFTIHLHGYKYLFGGK